MFNGEKIELKPGQLVTGRNNLSIETGEHPSKIYRTLKYLESEHQIEQLKTPRYTLITVKNWHRYQGSEQANGQAKPEKRTGKIKKPNTIKNNNNKYIGVSSICSSKGSNKKDTGGKKNMEEKKITGMEGKDKEEKKRYLEFVLLTEKEHKNLVKKLGKEKTGKMIEKLNNYIGSSGKYYDSHYYTILLWMLDEKEENQDEGPGYEKYKKS